MGLGNSPAWWLEKHRELEEGPRVEVLECRVFLTVAPATIVS